LQALYLALPLANAWVNYFSDPGSAPGKSGGGGPDTDRIYRWDAPNDFRTDAGLAGGLTWAAQDDFCGAMLPRFYAETQFDLVTCEALLDSVMRGFATWHENHRYLSFYDMTEECKHADPLSISTPPASNECARLEISITAGGPLRDVDDNAATVYNMPSNRRNWRSGTYSTAGDYLVASRAIEKSRLHFNTDHCWYLDNSFCAGFHKVDQRGTDVIALCGGLAFSAFGLALLVSLAFFYKMALPRDSSLSLSSPAPRCSELPPLGRPSPCGSSGARASGRASSEPRSGTRRSCC